MSSFSRVIRAAALFVFAASLVPQCFAQQPLTVPAVVHVIGLNNINHNTTGKLSIGKGTLEFIDGKKKASVTTASMDDVITGNESQRVVGGTLGTLTMFAPYGGGRFLSLFRTKQDTITIRYHDEAGGMHGAVFMMSAGRAAAIKKELVAEGAHASVPAETASPEPSSGSQKPKEKKR